MPPTGWKGARIYALGHSTRPQEELIDILRSFGVSTLADIRTIPRSRHNPQFNPDGLAPALERAGIRYVHLSRLGGLRKSKGDNPLNRGWRNASFRGFADYMQTEEFAAGLEELCELAAAGPVALMCAEAVPWRCHRSLVADALAARGIEVQQIQSAGRASKHRVTPFARFDGWNVTYPSAEPDAPGSGHRRGRR